MEMALDYPEFPMGMLSNVHLKRCKSHPSPIARIALRISEEENLSYCAGEDVLIEFIENLKSIEKTGPKAEAWWSDFSQRWFTLLPSTRPFTFHDFGDLADHVSGLIS